MEPARDQSWERNVEDIFMFGQLVAGKKEGVGGAKVDLWWGEDNDSEGEGGLQPGEKGVFGKGG